MDTLSLWLVWELAGAHWMPDNDYSTDAHYGDGTLYGDTYGGGFGDGNLDGKGDGWYRCDLAMV